MLLLLLLPLALDLQHLPMLSLLMWPAFAGRPGCEEAEGEAPTGTVLKVNEILGDPFLSSWTL